MFIMLPTLLSDEKKIYNITEKNYVNNNESYAIKYFSLNKNNNMFLYDSNINIEKISICYNVIDNASKFIYDCMSI